MNSGSLNKLHHDIHKQNVAEFFSQSTEYWSDAYADSDFDNGSFDAFAKGRRKELVLGLLDQYAAGRHLTVLDVGCGPGLFLQEAQRRGHTVYGIDLSDSMVMEANVRLGQNSTDCITCQQGDIECLPFESNSMDVIMCLGVLPYLRDDTGAVAELERVLKEGGFAIIVLPNLVKMGNLFDPYYYLVRGWQYLWYRQFRAAAGRDISIDPDLFGANSSFGIRRYSRAQISSLFAPQCFRVVENRGIDYGPPTIWKKRFLPDRISIILSKLLTSIVQKAALTWVTGMANESVLCVIKNKQGQEERSL